MGFEMVDYGDHMKIRRSGTEVVVARRGRSADEARERKAEDLRAEGEVVEERKRQRGCGQHVDT